MKRKIGILLLTVTAAAAMAAGLAACTSSDGASAYDLAVANGYSGTEAQWLESLKGDDGTTGATGATGTGIESVALNKYNDLVVTYTDETSTTLKYHGTIANPYQIYSGIYEAAYSDTYGYVSFLEEDYITVAAGETVYINYIIEDASNIYIGADGVDEDEISLCGVYNYVTYDVTGEYTWTTAGTVVYTAIPTGGAGAATIGITNSSDEEITVQTAVGEYTLTFMLDKTVGTTLTTDVNYAEATFTATKSGWYEFTLSGDGKANIYVDGEAYDDDWNNYYVLLNSITDYDYDTSTYTFSGEYTGIAYIPAGVTMDFYCYYFYSDEDADPATFALTITETTVDSSVAISKDGFTATLEGSKDIDDDSKAYTYYVTETGYYKITAAATTEGAAALIYIDEGYYFGTYVSPDSTVVIDTENGTTIGDYYTRMNPGYTAYYTVLNVGSKITIYSYYDATVTIESASTGTLTSEGLTLTLTGSEEGTTYAIEIAEGALVGDSTDYYGEKCTVYTITASNYTAAAEGESSDYLAFIEWGYGESLFNEADYDSCTIEVESTGYMMITVYADCTLTIAYTAATAAE